MSYRLDTFCSTHLADLISFRPHSSERRQYHANPGSLVPVDISHLRLLYSFESRIYFLKNEKKDASSRFFFMCIKRDTLFHSHFMLRGFAFINASSTRCRISEIVDLFRRWYQPRKTGHRNQARHCYSCQLDTWLVFAFGDLILYLRPYTS